MDQALKKSEWVKRLKVCELDHGGPHNLATVYGHTGRHCIRIQGTMIFVYSPGASPFESREE